MRVKLEKKGGGVLGAGQVKKLGSLPRHIHILNIYVSTPPPPPGKLVRTKKSQKVQSVVTVAPSERWLYVYSCHVLVRLPGRSANGKRRQHQQHRAVYQHPGISAFAIRNSQFEIYNSQFPIRISISSPDFHNYHLFGLVIYHHNGKTFDGIQRLV